MLTSILCFRHAENAFPYSSLSGLSNIASGLQTGSYLDISSRMTSNASGRGLIVSKLPLGICSTMFMVLGTAVTSREPRSTRRFSQAEEIEVSTAAKL